MDTTFGELTAVSFHRFWRGIQAKRTHGRLKITGWSMVEVEIKDL